MRTVVYVRPRTIRTVVKVAAWFVLLAVFSAHKGAGVDVFVVVTVVYLGLRLWARTRPPVPEPVQPSQDDALRLLRALHYLRSIEAQRDEESVYEASQHVEARRKA